MDIEKLVKVLVQLRSDSMQLNANASESEVTALMHRYDILFLGAKFNFINSIELCHTLQNYFHFETDIDELNNLVPKACAYLNMKYEPLVEVSNLGKTSKPSCYSITLW